MRTHCANLFLLTALAAQAVDLSVRVTDISGSAIANASVVVRSDGGGLERTGQPDGRGGYFFYDLEPGGYLLTVAAANLQKREQHMLLEAGQTLDVTLAPASLSQQVLVSATQLAGSPDAFSQIPGVVNVLDRTTLLTARVFTFDEALRKLPGVQARGEEGFGLRPNIGIRGLNPTRSNKVLLLEDGIPLSYAPYGDNASYYHPPVDRFDGIEVVKGSGQILYGPMTVGGVVNYLTPVPPSRPSGSLTLTGGNRDYFNGHARWGTTVRATGLLFDALRKQGEGSRDNVRTGLNDYTLKSITNIGERQTLGIKANYYGEDSRLTYSGLRESEWVAAPRQNPFRNDSFNGSRYGLSITHTAVFNGSMSLITNLYGARFSRDWWRQSSNSAQRPNTASNPACGGMENLLTTCGNEGRLRDYVTWGVDPRLHVGRRLFGFRNETDLGFRAHFEDQERIQQNGASPLARVGTVVENNERRNQAYAAFLQNRWVGETWSLTPGVRLEHVRYQRRNRLAGVSGATSLTQAIPGVGFSYHPSAGLTLFTGLHRGFTPPRTEDIINNNTGASVELDPELSWNYEAGARARISRFLSADAAFFRMKFSNQIVPASVAGGIGAALTNGGRTLHQGLELGSRFDPGPLFASRHSLELRVAYTYLPVARFEGMRMSAVPGFTNVSVSGNRLPYAPRHLATAALTWSHGSGWSALAEAASTGRQFSDDLNTIGGTPDGQRGLIPGFTIFNLALNYPLPRWRTTVFITVKNAGDRLYIADRSRGLLPGTPRLIQAGFRYEF